MRASHEKALGARCEQYAGVPDGLARRGDAFSGEVRFIEGTRRIAGGVLDREPRDAGLHAQPDVFGDLFGVVSVAGLEVGVYRNIDDRGDGGDVVEHEVAGYRPVGVGKPVAEGKAGAGRRERLETKRA